MGTQLDLFEYKDYSKDKVLLGMSGGINSMAVLCWLAESPKEFHPKELHLYYAHLKEHSPDTFKFVADGVRYARKVFPDVRFTMTRNSIMTFFKQQKIIPIPQISPCTKYIKLLPLERYAKQHDITENVVGYVKEEVKRRAKRMAKKQGVDMNNIRFAAAKVSFPLSDKLNEWCFEIVKKHLGWYPAIYDIRDPVTGKRLFTHNNCLPCKNMSVEGMKLVEMYYPEYWKAAMELSRYLKYHWGYRSDDFYTTFGREDYEVGENKQPCETCAFD